VDSDVDLEGSSSLQGDALDEEVDSNNGLERKLPIEMIMVKFSYRKINTFSVETISKANFIRKLRLI
jgi:hypothetical protein